MKHLASVWHVVVVMMMIRGDSDDDSDNDVREERGIPSER